MGIARAWPSHCHVPCRPQLVPPFEVLSVCYHRHQAWGRGQRRSLPAGYWPLERQAGACVQEGPRGSLCLRCGLLPGGIAGFGGGCMAGGWEVARVWLRLSSWPLRGPLPACPSHPCLPQSWNRWDQTTDRSEPHSACSGCGQWTVGLGSSTPAQLQPH